MRILQCIKQRAIVPSLVAAGIVLLIGIAAALIVVDRPSRALAQHDAPQTHADVTEFAVYAPYWSTEPGYVSTTEMMNYRVDEC